MYQLSKLSDFSIMRKINHLRTREVLLSPGEQKTVTFPLLHQDGVVERKGEGLWPWAASVLRTKLTQEKSPSAQLTGVEKHHLCVQLPPRGAATVSALQKVPLSGPWPDSELILTPSSHHFKPVSSILKKFLLLPRRENQHLLLKFYKKLVPL